MKFASRKAKWLAGGLFLGLSFAVFCVANERLTSWLTSASFREMLDRETSKGLKLDGKYSPLSRVGSFGVQADGFTGTKGQKTIVSIDAHQISGWFNPLGFFLQRWQLDDVHIKAGTVMLQKTEAPPGQKPPGRPWWGWFWPYRVHLEDVKVDDADALWRLQGKESGIYHAFLEITPNGHDFEYDARGGMFKTPFTPDLNLQHLHMLIRKPQLYCNELVLGDDPAHSEEQLRVYGQAGLQTDRSIKVSVDLTSLKLAPWLPKSLQAHVEGHASGHLDYESSGSGLETAQAQGHLSSADAVLHELAPVRHYITLTGSPDPGDLVLKECQADVKWQAGVITVQKIQVECAGVFRLEGDLNIAKDQTLSGTLQLGLTDPYLRWLRSAKETVFTRDANGYHFAAVRLSGTAKAPKEDLSTRIIAQVEKSPGTAFKLFFNQAGAWLNF
jgi:hypothetical protein